MTDLSQHGFALPSARAAGTRRPWPLASYILVPVAGVVGLYAGRAMGGDSAAFEDKLLLLLRFMAAMKFAGVVLGAALVHWRFRSQIPITLAASYLGALAIMAVASGLIWSLGGIALGATLFHIGLLMFLILAWKDDGVHLPTRR